MLPTGSPQVSGTPTRLAKARNSALWLDVERWANIMRFVIVPGIGNSDSGHWQSIWQATWGGAASRIAPRSWTEPDLDNWCEAIDREVRAEKDVVVVAHSLGCLAATHWIATEMREPILGVLLVSPPDRYADSFPVAASTFVGAAERPVDVPGLIVCSDDDPYCTLTAAKEIARHWELPTVSAGMLGHLNSDSGVGEWIQGQTVLSVFLAMTARRMQTQPEPGMWCLSDWGCEGSASADDRPSYSGRGRPGRGSGL